MPDIGKKLIGRVINKRAIAIGQRGGGNIISTKQGEMMNSGLNSNLLPAPIKQLDRDIYNKINLNIK